MKQNRFTEEQIITILKEVESGRKTVVAASREYGASEALKSKACLQWFRPEVHSTALLHDRRQFAPLLWLKKRNLIPSQGC